ncbi:MAG: 2-oxoacid:acceptor oxidoreductase family protein [Myxococcota bacterium]|nr:2-oxoacid:acceptor oxidoreductase family protein [Myxococcota bacterium]
MEREVLLTGIGGQGVQLAAHVLARAAVREGRHVLLLGTYGGTMRGGNTDSTLVVGDRPVSSPPIVSTAWSAILVHHAFWAPTRAKLAPGAVVVVNESLFEGDLDRGALHVVDVPANRIADEAGSPLAASLVLVGAYAGVTGLVGLESLIEAMRDSLPAYRRQHAEGNAKALRAGFDAVPAESAPAWQEDAA